MKKNRCSHSVILLLFLSVVLVLGGCVKIRESIWDWKGKPESTANTPPAEILSKGQYYYHEGLFNKALEEYQKIKQFHPLSSDDVLLAELGSADCYYALRQYTDAIIAYNDFINLHPTSERMPYCIYQVGMCYYEQIKPSSKDQTATVKARQEFEKLVARFPSSGYTFLAEQKLRDCLERLAERDFNIAIFYMKRGNYPAAVNRLAEMLEAYPKAVPLPSSQQLLNIAQKLAKEAKQPKLSEMAMLGSFDGVHSMSKYEQATIDKIARILGDVKNAHKIVFNLAWDAYTGGDYTLAMRRTNLAWLLDKDNYRNYYLFGVLLDEQYKNASNEEKPQLLGVAIHCFREALRLNSQHALSMAYLAHCYNEKIRQHLMTEGYSIHKVQVDWLEGESGHLLDKALMLADSNAQKGLINYFFAKFLALKGDYARAWEKIKETRELGSGNLLDDEFVKEVEDSAKPSPEKG